MQALRQDDTVTEGDTLEPKKANMVEALTKALGIVKIACESCGISRNTNYRWLKDDPDHKHACHNLPDHRPTLPKAHHHTPHPHQAQEG